MRNGILYVDNYYAPDLMGEDPLEWQNGALCSQTDPELFFPLKGGSTKAAKKVCAECDVRDRCLEYALQNNEQFGIWGGVSERARRQMLKDMGVEETNDDEFAESYGGREAESEWEIQSLLQGEEEEYGSDLSSLFAS